MRIYVILFVGLSALTMIAVACSDTDSSNGTPDAGTVDGDTDSDSDSDTDVDADTDADTDADALVAGCAPGERVGGFSILLGEDYTSVSGAVMDGVAPSNVPDVLGTSGTCTLFGPRDLFCDPACTTLGETCGEEGVCIAAPTKQDVGTVTVDGMNTEVVIDLGSITSDYSLVFDDPYPGFDEGAGLTLTATGGVFEPITLTGSGPGPVTGAQESVTVQEDTPVTLSWDAGGVADTQMQVLLDVNVHGARTGWIVCDAPDSGDFEIPADLVTSLINLGLSGFPKLVLTRRSIDTAEVSSGCVELSVHAQTTLTVEIPGLLSCNTDEDCESGQVCEEDLVCR